MNARETARLAKRIATEEPTIHVRGTRRYGGGSYAIDVVDTVSGYPFTVHSHEDWDERRREWDFHRTYALAYEEAR